MLPRPVRGDPATRALTGLLAVVLLLPAAGAVLALLWPARSAGAGAGLAGLVVATAACSGIGLVAWWRTAVALRRITTRQRAHDDRHRLASVLEDAPVGIFRTDRDGACLWSNAKLGELTGLPPTRNLGFGWVGALHPDDAEAVTTEWRACADAMRSYSLAHRFRQPDGAVVWVQGSAQVILDEHGDVDGHLGFVADTTQQRLDGCRSAEATARLAAIVQSTDAAIVGWGRDARVTSWNAAAARMYGRTAEQALGRPVLPAIPTTHGVSASELLAAVARGTAVQAYDGVTANAGGAVLDVSVTMSPIHGAAGEVVGGSLIVRDLAESRRQEQALRAQQEQAQAALAQARDAAAEAPRLTSQFLATMSHEIRTPMNGVIGLSSVLLTSPLTAAQRQQVAGIRSAGTALLALIDDILDMSEIEAGRLVLHETDLSLREVVDGVVALVDGAARDKDLELRALHDAALPDHVRGDARRLRQILLNLTANAVAFTDRGGVTLRTSLADDGSDHGDGQSDSGRDAGGETATAATTVRFEVTDTGVGLRADQVGQLFLPFSQTEPTSTGRTGTGHTGTGLRLAICRQLTEAMGGRIGVRSRRGEGSTFWCTIPFASSPAVPGTDPVAAAPHGAHVPTAQVPTARVAADHLPAARVPTQAADLSPASLGRVLLAEDDEIHQQVATGMLQQLGYAVDVAPDGRRALDMLAGGGYRAVLMDCQMPVLDGFAATGEIRRAAGDGPRIPVIALTAGAHEQDRRRCEEAGMDDYLAKPLSRDELAAALTRWTAPAAAARPGS